LLIEEEGIAALKDVGGLFAFWHRGIRPQWIYVGHTEDLSTTLATAQNDPDLALYDRNDGVYVAWAECVPEDRTGEVLYLKNMLSPAIDQLPLGALEEADPETKPIEFPLPVD
jgi:hypothetical protein